jgi:hypothetical protein
MQYTSKQARRMIYSTIKGLKLVSVIMEPFSLLAMGIISRKDGGKYIGMRVKRKRMMNSRIKNKTSIMRRPRLASTSWLIKHRRRHAYAMHYA